ncbi:DedA family protein [Ignatzschineria sp. LJL83]
MEFESFVTTITEFTREHQYWAPVIIFLLAFGESLALVSLLIPATVILVGLSVLIGESGLSFWMVWIAATLGAFLGDWVSYGIGYHYKLRVYNMWPFTKKPELLVKGQGFFDKWGIWSVFLGRFLGPFRATIPLIAGICMMPKRYFQWSNILSAMIWAFGILAPGAFGIQWLSKWIG